MLEGSAQQRQFNGASEAYFIPSSFITKIMKQMTKVIVPSIALSEVEQELVKMRKVSSDIRLVLEKILASNEIDCSANQTIVDDLFRELLLVVARVKQLPIKTTL